MKTGLGEGALFIQYHLPEYSFFSRRQQSIAGGKESLHDLLFTFLPKVSDCPQAVFHVQNVPQPAKAQRPGPLQAVGRADGQEHFVDGDFPHSRPIWYCYLHSGKAFLQEKQKIRSGSLIPQPDRFLRHMRWKCLLCQTVFRRRALPAGFPCNPELSGQIIAICALIQPKPAPVCLNFIHVFVNKNAPHLSVLPEK